MMKAGSREQSSSQAARAGAAPLPPSKSCFCSLCEAVGMSLPPQNGVYTQGQLLTLVYGLVVWGKRKTRTLYL